MIARLRLAAPVLRELPVAVVVAFLLITGLARVLEQTYPQPPHAAALHLSR